MGIQPSFFQNSARCDPGYKNVRDEPSLLECKNYVESLWHAYAPHADPHFRSDAVTHFQERFWEMYLGATFLAHGFSIDRGGNTGPEFFLSSTPRKVWIEAIAPGPGDGPDAVPPPQYGAPIAQRVPVNEIILRLRQAIEEKKKKHADYVARNVISADEIYIIAINSKRIRTIVPEPELPIIVKSVYPFGNLAVALDKKTLEVVETRHEYRDAIEKRSGSKVSTSVFFDNEYAGISAVIYSSVDCCNKPQKFGTDFVLVHSAAATNKLAGGTFMFGREYWVENDALKSKDWNESPN